MSIEMQENVAQALPQMQASLSPALPECSDAARSPMAQREKAFGKNVGRLDSGRFVNERQVSEYQVEQILQFLGPVGVGKTFAVGSIEHPEMGL